MTRNQNAFLKKQIKVSEKYSNRLIYINNSILLFVESKTQTNEHICKQS